MGKSVNHIQTHIQTHSSIINICCRSVYQMYLLKIVEHALPVVKSL